MLKGCGPDRSLLLLITLRTIVPIEPMKRPRMYPIRLPETWTLLAVVVILWLRRAVPQKVSSEKITPHVVVIPLIHATIIVIISVGALREEKIAPVGNVGVVQLEQQQQQRSDEYDGGGSRYCVAASEATHANDTDHHEPHHSLQYE